MKGESKTLTKGSNELQLPEGIRQAILDGYDVLITREVKNGAVMAKISYHRVRVAGREILQASTATPLVDISSIRDLT